jgi:hypothetical protein
MERFSKQFANVVFSKTCLVLTVCFDLRLSYTTESRVAGHSHSHRHAHGGGQIKMKHLGFSGSGRPPAAGESFKKMGGSYNLSDTLVFA